MRLAAGMAAAPRAATTAMVVTRGRRVTSMTQRLGFFVPSARSDLGAFRRFQPMTRPPANPSRAGVRVRATTTAIATATAAAIPIVVRNGMPAKERPMRAMSTVTPAKTTAEPAVPVARAADSSGSMPARTWS